MTAIALIPARGGSKRIPGKNVRDLAGRPLIAYTVEAALESGCFEKVLVSSDDVATLEIAASLGADCVRRPEEFAGDTSPDIDWVRHALETVGAFDPHPMSLSLQGRGMKNAILSLSKGARPVGFDTFSILRPTSPFRTAETIRRAFQEWEDANGVHTAACPLSPRGRELERGGVVRGTTVDCAGAVSPSPKSSPIKGEEKTDTHPAPSPYRMVREGCEHSAHHRYTSLRAVEPVSQHPGKMWQVRGQELVPLMLQPAHQPFHDSQMAALPEVWVQNASLEIAWVSTVTKTGTISGNRVLAFKTTGDEGFDLNTEYDWQIAEKMMAERERSQLNAAA